MARRVRYSELENRTARDRLKPGRSHWRALDPGRLSLGYRRVKKAVPGYWLKRTYVGTDERGVGHYRQSVLGVADDHADADGVNVFNFAQAQKLANDQRAPGSPLTVKEAIERYVTFLRSKGKATQDAEQRVE
jgi:hypothetical protein